MARHTSTVFASNLLRWAGTLLLAFPSAAAATLLDTEDAALAVQKLVADAIDESAVGLSVAVAYGDELVISEGFGLANVEHDVSVDPETTFRIGSITKQVTAAMIMRLVEAGELDVDDLITDYVSYPVGDREVTIRHLLTHTSGIKSYTGIEAVMNTISLDRSHDELLAFVREEPFDFEPGDKYLYNNTGYYLLGMILENVTGKPFEDLVHDLADELGLERTFYGSNSRIIRNRAQGYRLLDGELAHAQLIAMTQPFAAGSMLSCATDLVRWQRALINGEVVTMASYAAMLRPYLLNDGTETTYGFGLGLGEDQGNRVVQHGGGIYGFNSMLSYYPDTDVSVGVISNGPYGAARLAQDIGRAIHGTSVEIDDLPVAEAQGRMLAGSYRASAGGLELAVTYRDGALFIRASGQGDARMLRQSDGEFRASFDPDVRVVFQPGDPSPGFSLHQGAEVVFERIE